MRRHLPVFALFPALLLVLAAAASTAAAGDAMQTRLADHVHALAAVGPRHADAPGSLEAALDYVHGELAGMGIAAQRRPFSAQGREFANLEALLPGSGGSAAVAALAHLDTVPGTLGANDNASGAAVLLETARLLRERARRADVLLVFTVNEEAPRFATSAMGASRWLEAARSRGLRIKAALAVDSVGRFSHTPGSQKNDPVSDFGRDTGDFLALAGTPGSRELAERGCAAVVQAKGPDCMPVILGPLAWPAQSDIRPFVRAGIPAVLATDTAARRTPDLHTPRDTPGKLDFGFMAETARGLSEMLAEMAAGTF